MTAMVKSYYKQQFIKKSEKIEINLEAVVDIREGQSLSGE